MTEVVALALVTNKNSGPSRRNETGLAGLHQRRCMTSTSINMTSANATTSVTCTTSFPSDLPQEAEALRSGGKKASPTYEHIHRWRARVTPRRVVSDEQGGCDARR